MLNLFRAELYFLVKCLFLVVSAPASTIGCMLWHQKLALSMSLAPGMSLATGVLLDLVKDSWFFCCVGLQFRSLASLLLF